MDCFPGEIHLKEAKVVEDLQCTSGVAVEVARDSRCAIAQDRRLELVIGLSYQACGFLDLLGNEFIITQARKVDPRRRR